MFAIHLTFALESFFFFPTFEPFLECIFNMLVFR